LGAVLISRSQPKILRKIQKNLRGYIPAIPRFLHVCPPRHLVFIVYWSGIGQNGQKCQYLAQNDQNCKFWAKIGHFWAKNPNFYGSKYKFWYQPHGQLVGIIFWLDITSNGPKMPIFGQKCQLWAKFGRFWAKNPVFGGRE